MNQIETLKLGMKDKTSKEIFEKEKSSRKLVSSPFQMPDFVLDEEEDVDTEIIRKTALPDQIPQAPSLQDLGANSSPTVDFLISQNEDLMARLKVQLKRAGQFDQEMQLVRSRLEQALQSRNHLKDRLALWEEKEKVWRDENRTVQELNKQLEEEIQLLRIQQDSFESALSSQRESWSQERKSLVEGLRSLQSYRRRMKTWIYPSFRKLQDDNYELYCDSQRLQKLLKEKSEKFEATVQTLQNHVKDLERAQEQLVLSRDSQVSSLKVENQALQIKIEELARQLKTAKIQADRADQFENQWVSEKRARQAADQSQVQQLKEFETEKQGLKSEIFDLQLHVDQLKAHLKKVESENQGLKENLKNTNTQMEQLRKLWAKSQNEINELKLKNSGLEQLNLELSQIKS